MSGKGGFPFNASDPQFEDRMRHLGYGALKSVTGLFNITEDRLHTAGALSGVDPATLETVYIPANAVIVDAFIDVATTFTSDDTDSATIKVGLTEDDDEFVAAIAISDASNVWDAGRHGTLVNSYALDGDALTAIEMAAARSATWMKTTKDNALLLTSAAGTSSTKLSAGKMYLTVLYVVNE